MTTSFLPDKLAIDTNVFRHLFNPQDNTCLHINKLLGYLVGEGATLVVDDGGDIAREYNYQLARRLADSSDTRNEVQILRYFMLYAQRHHIAVDENDELMAAIKKVIVEVSEDVDRSFVYVALQRGTTLISNDRRHIINGPRNEFTPRRTRLLHDTANLRPSGADIMTSWKASTRLHR